MEFETMMRQLQSKISQVQSLRTNLEQEIRMSEHNKLISGFLRKQFKPWIIECLSQYNRFQIESMGKIKTHYDQHLRTMRNYYEQEVDELKNQIKRQYKVIGLMKQEVQDLMMLLNQNQRIKDHKQQQQIENRDSQRKQEQQKRCRSTKRNVVSDLEIIQEEETERTIVSSARSNSHNNQVFNDNFIKIQGESQSNTDRSQYNINSLQQRHMQIQISDKLNAQMIKSLNGQVPRIEEQFQEGRFKMAKKGMWQSSEITECQLQPPLDNYDQLIKSQVQKHRPCQPEYSSNYKSDSKQKKEQFFQIYQILMDLDKQEQFSRVKLYSKEDQMEQSSIHLRESQYHSQYNSIPVSINNRLITADPQFQDQILSQATNMDSNLNTNSQNTPISNVSKRQTSQVSEIQENRQTLQLINTQKTNFIANQKIRQPKTKEFLQQFRKTFNKCLSSMEAKHKYSNKFNKKIAKNNLLNQNQFETRDSSNMQVTFGKNKSISESLLCEPYEKQRKKKNNTKQNIQVFVSNSKPSRINQEKQSSQYGKIITEIVKNRQKSSKFIVGQKKNEIRYEGGKKDNQRHGSGTIYYSNGLCFEGEFINGVRQGYGTLKFNHIQIYNGAWSNDQINGQGKIRNCAIINKRKSEHTSQHCLSKWISYCGQFKNSLFDGQGTLYLQGGQKFIGRFISGVAQGQGTIYRKNGQTESGIWKNNAIISN